MAGFAFEHLLPRMDGEPSEYPADPAYDDLVHEEAARLVRIADGLEHACLGCGCSESRACPGGCVWANERFCSRCAR